MGLLAIAAVAVGCGGGGGSDARGGEPTGSTPAWCETLGFAVEEVLASDDRTLRDLLDAPAWDDLARGVGASLSYLGDRGGEPEHRALADHLRQRYEAESAEPPEDPPAPTDALRATADELDEAIAEGACG
jgi:hypothetical protein